VPAQSRTETTIAVYGLFALLSLVLLIICGNVAGMVLARSVTREQELAVRMALGSGRRRLARLLLVEALLLAFAGVSLGILFGVWGMDLVFASIPGFPPLAFGVEGPVLGFGLLLGFGATLAVGLLPAFRFSRPELVSALKDDSGGGGRRVSRIHRFAASAQAGVALTLLVTCGLFLRALGVMEDRDFGFEPRDLVTTRMDLFQEGYESQEAAELFLDRAWEALEEVPGVISVSVADGIPLDLSGNFTSAASADQPDEVGARIQVEFTRVSAHFFETVGAPILRGRGIEYGDNLSSEPVVVVTESLASRLWPGEDALGRSLRSGVNRTGARDYTVVGIVGFFNDTATTENWPNIFFSFRQTYGPRMMFVLKTAGDLSALSRPIQTALLSVDPGLSFPVLVTSESMVERGTRSQRMLAGMAGGLGILALLLSAIGVYGVVAFTVTSRTREIGLRMAMGASRGKVLRDVLVDALRLAMPGLAMGTLLAGGVAASLQAELFGLGPADPVSFLGAGAVLLLVILVASLVPARAASGIDPVEAVRGGVSP
jgi:putative ABC transport system permease protein